MNITIPTTDEFEVLKSKSIRVDWSPIYRALSEHGRLILDEEPDNIRSALANYYRGKRRRARIVTTDDGRCLIFLEQRV